MENLTVKVDGETKELIFREGTAAPSKEPLVVNISGDINTVTEFLKKRKDNNGVGLQKVDPNSAVIIVDETEMYIKLLLDPENPYGATITGKLEFTPELKQLKINGSETFTREQLIKLIRFNSILFPDKDKHEQLLKAYQAFTVSAHINASTTTDTRGNKNLSLDKKLDTNLPNDFILRMPIFRGQGPETFRVEIAMDSTDASVRFWFESVELNNLIEQRKIEIFQERVQKFEHLVIVRK